MKPHPKISKTVKWGGVGVTVLLVVAWIGSGWFSWFAHLGRGYFAGVDCGQIVLVRSGTTNPGAIREMTALFRTSHPFQMEWWIESRAGRIGQMVYIPLWIGCVPALLITLLAWRQETLANRRNRLNLCPKCDYDRTDLAADVICPECGVAPNR